MECRSPDKNDPLYVDNLVNTNGETDSPLPPPPVTNGPLVDTDPGTGQVSHCDQVDMDKVSTTGAASCSSPVAPVSDLTATNTPMSTTDPGLESGKKMYFNGNSEFMLKV